MSRSVFGKFSTLVEAGSLCVPCMSSWVVTWLSVCRSCGESYDTFCFCLGLIKPAVWYLQGSDDCCRCYMMRCFESWYSYLLGTATFAFFIVLDSMSTAVSSRYSYILSHFGTAWGAFTCWNYPHIVAEVAGSICTLAEVAGNIRKLWLRLLEVSTNSFAFSPVLVVIPLLLIWCQSHFGGSDLNETWACVWAL